MFTHQCFILIFQHNHQNFILCRHLLAQEFSNLSQFQIFNYPCKCRNYYKTALNFSWRKVKFIPHFWQPLASCKLPRYRNQKFHIFVYCAGLCCAVTHMFAFTCFVRWSACPLQLRSWVFSKLRIVCFSCCGRCITLSMKYAIAKFSVVQECMLPVTSVSFCHHFHGQIF